MGRPKGSHNTPRHEATPAKEQLTGEQIHTLPDPPAENHPVPQMGASRESLAKIEEGARAGKAPQITQPKSNKEIFTAFLSEKESAAKEFPGEANAYRIAREKFLEVFA
jgi:hypothetical protein